MGTVVTIGSTPNLIRERDILSPGHAIGGFLVHVVARCTLVALALWAFQTGCAARLEPTCGNGRCEPGETLANCIVDCRALECGNGVCSGQESTSTCPVDCFCGNGSCDRSETWGTCPGDCGNGFCGDDYCQPGEGESSCGEDCYCGNGTCDAGETPISCAEDCHGSYCGDGLCDDGETTATCLEDCPSGCDHALCDPWPPCGCEAGLRCMVGSSFQHSCTEPGQAEEGELCSTYGDCAADTMCVLLPEGGTVSACYHYCLDDDDCQSGPGSLCESVLTGAPAGFPRLCTASCNPVTGDGCPTGAACYVFFLEDGRGGSDCYAPPGSSTGTCNSSTLCAPGMICISTTLTCRYYCRRNLGNADCPSGQSCLRFVNPIVIDTTEYGVCSG